ncbi:unnamed protein product [Periconia digitata]|uniref:Uncharacterized protein n=1 Tax=Periconia digitata TaxID=1303443 RepID=A0A9W4UGD5_9PLEO|nr:unnamed protein product [Periconia digitata]
MKSKGLDRRRRCLQSTWKVTKSHSHPYLKPPFVIQLFFNSSSLGNSISCSAIATVIREKGNCVLCWVLPINKRPYQTSPKSSAWRSSTNFLRKPQKDMSQSLEQGSNVNHPPQLVSLLSCHSPKRTVFLHVYALVRLPCVCLVRILSPLCRPRFPSITFCFAFFFLFRPGSNVELLT